MWKGLLKSGPHTLETLKEQIEDLILERETPTLPPLLWSHELAHAAANYLTSIKGSRIIPGLQREEDSTAEFIDEFVSYKSHRRISLVPWKFFWVSSLETIFDLILDDFEPTWANREALLYGDFTHVGIACDCHPRLG